MPVLLNACLHFHDVWGKGSHTLVISYMAFPWLCLCIFSGLKWASLLLAFPSISKKQEQNKICEPLWEFFNCTYKIQPINITSVQYYPGKFTEWRKQLTGYARGVLKNAAIVSCYLLQKFQWMPEILSNIKPYIKCSLLYTYAVVTFVAKYLTEQLKERRIHSGSWFKKIPIHHGGEGKASHSLSLGVWGGWPLHGSRKGSREQDPKWCWVFTIKGPPLVDHLHQIGPTSLKVP